MQARGIGAISFDSTVGDEGYSGAFVPIVLNNGTDFDYDSRDGLIYWIETAKGNLQVKTKHNF